MKTTWMIWIPRVLVLLIALFWAVFSLDVFEGNAPFSQKLLDLLIHNLPSFILLFVLALTWNRAFWAGILFALVTIATVIFFGRTATPLPTFLITTLPAALISLLFFLARYLEIR